MPSAQLESIIAMLKSRPAPATPPTMAEQRESFELSAQLFPPPAGAQSITVDANGVPADWVWTAESRSDAAVLYLHGGGYVIGSRNTHRGLAARIAKDACARVLLVEYRLAPEHPYPAAVDDALQSYRWLLAQDLAPRRITVAGDSAGGGLTLATLLAIKQQGLPMPACAVCLSPWVDLESTGASAQPGGADDPMIQLAGLRAMGTIYAGGRLREPLASPLYADPRGFPPLLIQVGTRELLLDDSKRFAEIAQKAGVSVDLQVEEGLVHVWQMFGDIPEALSAIRQIGDFVQKHTAK